MKRILTVLLFSLLTSQVAQAQPCTVDLQKSLGLCAQLEWLHGPVLNIHPRDEDHSALRITFWKESGGSWEQAPVPENLLVQPWMNMGSHGHSTHYVETRTESAIELTEVLFRQMGRFWWLIQFFSDEDGDGVITEKDKLIIGHVITFDEESGGLESHHHHHHH